MGLFMTGCVMWACDPVLATEVVNSYQAVGPLFVQTLKSLLAAQCALVGDQVWPSDAAEAVLNGNYEPCFTYQL